VTGQLKRGYPKIVCDRRPETAASLTQALPAPIKLRLKGAESEGARGSTPPAPSHPFTRLESSERFSASVLVAAQPAIHETNDVSVGRYSCTRIGFGAAAIETDRCHCHQCSRHPFEITRATTPKELITYRASNAAPHPRWFIRRSKRSRSRRPEAFGQYEAEAVVSDHFSSACGSFQWHD
jgi:hypothetical protein